VLAIGEIHESICADLLRWSTKYSIYVKTLIKNIVVKQEDHYLGLSSLRIYVALVVEVLLTTTVCTV
jgi:hypothetical protein